MVVVRWRANGRGEVGAFLVDCWCLGVRVAVWAENYTEREFKDSLRQHLPDDQREPIHPACAKKLIDGAVAYAQQFGFAPDREYKKARRVLSGVKAADCPETFPYGKDGKPMFVSSESDSPERIRRVLAMLVAHCSENGFHYLCRYEPPPSWEEAGGTADEDIHDPQVTRQALADWLDQEPDTVPRFHEVSGLVAAMQLCPEVLMPTMILEVLWGPDGRTWKGEEEMQSFLSLLMDYWNDLSTSIADALAAGSVDGSGIVDVREEDFEDEFLMLYALGTWSAGFRRAIKLRPDAWAGALQRADLAGDWAVIEWWAGFSKRTDKKAVLAYLETRPPRRLGTAVAALARALRPQHARPPSP